MKSYKLLRGSATIRAEAGRPPRIELHAYNGGPLPVDGFAHPVIVDLRGLEYQQTTPVVIEHDTSHEGVLGQTESIDVSLSTGVIRAAGVVLGTGKKAAAVREMAAAGFAWQASICAVIHSSETVPQGQAVVVNGQTFQGPVIVARRASLREISFVATGADNRTAARIAAALAAEGKTMPTFEEWVAKLALDFATLNEVQYRELSALYVQLGGDDKNVPPFGGGGGTPDAKAVQKAAASLVRSAENRDRFEAFSRRLQVLKASGSPMFDRAVSEGWDDTKLELEILRAERPKAPLGRTHGHGGDPQQVVEACFMIRAGREKLAEKTYGEHVMEATRDVRARSFVDLCETSLRAAHCDVPHGREAMLRAAFSTANIPNILSNVIDKTIEEAYLEAKATWKSFARILPAANFRPQTAIRPSAMENLSEMGPNGEITHGQLKEESTYQWKIDTYSEMLRVNRQMVYGDDLNFLDQLPAMFGKAAARTLSDLIWRTIMANAGSFFAAGNANYIEGAGTVLSLTSLSQLVTAMLKQRDAAGNDLDIKPVTLVTPPELGETGRSVLNSELIAAAVGTPTGNALRNIVNLDTESRLSNTDKFSGASATAWYLFASPADMPIVVGFLDGQQTPKVETFGLDHDPEYLAIAYRVYHDFGCALGDPKAAAKSKGAA